MNNKKTYKYSILSSLLLAASANAAVINLVNGDFMADTWVEEQFIQNTGNNTGLITGWTTEGLVRGYNFDEDGDGNPLVNGPNSPGFRVWGGWLAGDGLRNLGFQNFQTTQNALSQDTVAFTVGETYSFSIDIAPGFEASNQDGFAQIIRASDGTVLNEVLFPVMNSGSNTSSTQTVTYTATAADTGLLRIRFGTDTSVNTGGTAILGNPLLQTVIPEPSSVILLGFGALAGITRRRR